MSRGAARVLATVGALTALGWAAYTGVRESLPQLRVYDGYWMLLGGAVATGVAAPMVWRWPRERSLPVVVLASVAGCWLPLVVLALRQHIPVLARLRGSWVLMGADVVGVAVPLGVACLWFALREPTRAGEG